LTHSLPDLLAGAPGAESVEAIAVTGVNADSRAIVEGDAFFALPGTHAHGDAYVPQAVERGAVVIVTDRPCVPEPDIAVVVVENVRAAYAMAAARAAGPQPENIVGITGTSGKTSIVSFVRQIWEACGIRSASIGTLGVDIGGKIVGGALTTPDARTLHTALAELKAAGIDHVAIEASSHGLDQHRLDGVRFSAIGFSNLSHDHLDYHADMDAYREAKLRLFRDLLNDGGSAVVNSDDPEHMPFMFAALDKGATLLTVGEEGAYIEVSSVEQNGLGQHVKGKLVGEPLDFVLPLVGAFQVNNAVMAAALAVQTGADPKKIEGALSNLKGARGRMERAGEINGASIIIDYAHKPDALEQALEALRPFVKGKLVVVFGCGGDRDTKKRPVMGEIAARLADKVIVTDDNPRTENADDIRKQILAAAPGAIGIGDRAKAIQTAIAELEKGDILLIAGKGHEDYQIVGDKKTAFSDHAVVAKAIKG